MVMSGLELNLRVCYCLKKMQLSEVLCCKLVEWIDIFCFGQELVQ